jgi:hypothetical protein
MMHLTGHVNGAMGQNYGATDLNDLSFVHLSAVTDTRQ